MECAFHAGNEAVTACVQCNSPICPLCASETNQIHLCLNCYRSHVEELSATLGSASVRPAKERRKAKLRLGGKRGRKEGAAEAPPAEIEPTFRMEATEGIWEREGYEPVAAERSPVLTPAAAEEIAAPPAPEEVPLSKKELARLRKEEAKRRKLEKKMAKRAKAEEAAAAEEIAAPPAPEPAPFFEPSPEPPAPPPETRPASAPGPLPDITFEFPIEPEKEGVKLPRLEDRLEFLPPLEEEEGPPPGLEPPDGFFD